MSKPNDLVQGTLDLLLLKILALEPLHGWAISLRLKSHLRRRAAGQRRIALPGPAQARAGRLDHRRVEADREQPAREVLFAHAPRQEAARIGGGELAAAVVRHLARRPALGGLERHADRTLVVHGAACGSGPSSARAASSEELDEELQFHLEHKIEEGIASGLSPRRGALRGAARDGRTRTTQRRDARHAPHPLADRLRRRRALRDPEPAPHARPDGVRGRSRWRSASA